MGDSHASAPVGTAPIGTADGGSEPGPARPHRRAVLIGAGAAGLTTVLLACGSSSDDGPSSSSTSTSGAPAPSSSSSAGGDTSAGGTELATTSEIPLNGGKVFMTQKIVVTQPSSGVFKAFTAVCTHQGCTVATVENNVIQCPCHGSQYSAADGSVKRGPAQQPLAAKTVRVQGDEVLVS